MRCKKIRGIILTDYLDGELTPEMEYKIKEHLKNCVNCREFETSVKKIVMGLFKSLERINPPASVWSGIKEFLEKEDRRKRWINFPEFVLPLWRPVCASILILAVIIGILRASYFYKQRVISNYLQSQIEFLSNFSSEEEESDVNLGTEVEKILSSGNFL